MTRPQRAFLRVSLKGNLTSHGHLPVPRVPLAKAWVGEAQCDCLGGGAGTPFAPACHTRQTTAAAHSSGRALQAVGMIGMVAYFAYLVGDYMGLSGIVSLFCCAVRGPCRTRTQP